MSAILITSKTSLDTFDKASVEDVNKLNKEMKETIVSEIYKSVFPKLEMPVLKLHARMVKITKVLPETISRQTLGMYSKLICFIFKDFKEDKEFGIRLSEFIFMHNPSLAFSFLNEHALKEKQNKTEDDILLGQLKKALKYERNEYANKLIDLLVFSPELKIKKKMLRVLSKYGNEMQIKTALSLLQKRKEKAVKIVGKNSHDLLKNIIQNKSSSAAQAALDYFKKNNLVAFFNHSLNAGYDILALALKHPHNLPALLSYLKFCEKEIVYCYLLLEKNRSNLKNFEFFLKTMSQSNISISKVISKNENKGKTLLDVVCEEGLYFQTELILKYFNDDARLKPLLLKQDETKYKGKKNTYQYCNAKYPLSGCANLIRTEMQRLFGHEKQACTQEYTEEERAILKGIQRKQEEAMQEKRKQEQKHSLDKDIQQSLQEVQKILKKVQKKQTKKKKTPVIYV